MPCVLTTKKFPIPRLSSVAKAMDSDYNLELIGNHWICLRCCRRKSTKDPSCKAWLESRCLPNYGQVDALMNGILKPCRIPPHVPICIGYHQVNLSHRLFVFKGLFYCDTCAEYGICSPIKLKSKCEGKCKPSNASNLSKLRNGVLPAGLKYWPQYNSHAHGVPL